jgi:hypothetical protein
MVILLHIRKVINFYSMHATDPLWRRAAVPPGGTALVVRSGVHYNNKTMRYHCGTAHSCSSFADLVIKNIQRVKTNRAMVPPGGTALVVRSGVQYNNKTMRYHCGAVHSCHKGVVDACIRGPRSKTSYAGWFFGKLAVQRS